MDCYINTYVTGLVKWSEYVLIIMKNSQFIFSHYSLQCLSVKAITRMWLLHVGFQIFFSTQTMHTYWARINCNRWLLQHTHCTEEHITTTLLRNANQIQRYAQRGDSIQWYTQSSCDALLTFSSRKPGKPCGMTMM